MSVLLQWAIPGPQSVRTGNRNRLSRFYFIHNATPRESGGTTNEPMAYCIPRIDPEEVNADDLTDVLALDISGSVKAYMDKCEKEGNLKNHLPSPAMIMSFVQRAWRLNPLRANRHVNRIFACCKTCARSPQIVGVFHFSRQDENGNNIDKFMAYMVDGDHRYAFLARPAEEDEWNEYVGKFLPPVKPGEANPVRYYYCEQD